MDINDLSYELDNITDEDIRKFTLECLEKAPPHFWYRPASSTGKYHAKEENEQGGLVLHTKRVCKVGELLIEAWQPPPDADIIRSACILHDICKYGNSYSAYRYTISSHPLLAYQFILKLSEGHYDNLLLVDKCEKIGKAVSAHMGKWGSSFEPEPENLVVHLSDYLATKMYMLDLE